MRVPAIHIQLRFSFQVLHFSYVLPVKYNKYLLRNSIFFQKIHAHAGGFISWWNRNEPLTVGHCRLTFDFRSDYNSLRFASGILIWPQVKGEATMPSGSWLIPMIDPPKRNISFWSPISSSCINFAENCRWQSKLKFKPLNTWYMLYISLGMFFWALLIPGDFGGDLRKLLLWIRRLFEANSKSILS